MNTGMPPTISSFVIRFVVEDASVNEARPVYHGAIRHIQSAEELNFSVWQEAVEFMRRFVPLEESDCDETHPEK